MAVYEYKVVPAPVRGEKAKGLKTGAERFAHALENLMNAFGRDGWEYVRADTLPSEERTGFTGRTTVYQNLLVFRRAIDGAEAEADEGPDPNTAAGRSLLSFGRLRFGGAAPAEPRLAVRAEPPAAEEGAAPRLGPADAGLPREP